MGEAPARSSLVPRDLTAEFVFDASRFARAFTNVSTSYGVFVPVRWIYATSYARVIPMCVRLTAFGLVVIRQLSVPCLLQLCSV